MRIARSEVGDRCEGKRLRKRDEGRHGSKDVFDGWGVDVADEQADEVVARFRVMAHEVSEGEAVGVEGIDELAHGLHSAIELFAPSAECRGAEVARGERGVNGVGGAFSGVEREEDAGGIDGVEETEGVADEDPAVAGALSGGVGEVTEDVYGGDARGTCESRLDAGAEVDFLGEDFLGVSLASGEEEFGVCDDADAGDVVCEGNGPEPAAALSDVNDEGRAFVAS